jgi:hypothetical protein
MTLRANITTTYRETNTGPPPASKNLQKKTADKGVHETEGTRNSMKPAMKTPDLGGVPPAVRGGNRSAVSNNSQTSAATDAFERSLPKDKSAVAQGDKPASGMRPETGEREVASKPAAVGDESSSGQPIITRAVEESPADHKHSAPTADRSPGEYSRSMIKKVASLEFTKTDESQDVSSNGKTEGPASSSQSLPVATPPKIRLAEPSAKAATSNSATNPATTKYTPAGFSDEDAMQRELTAALQFEQVPKGDLQSDSDTRGDVAKHLQSEGVFGISATGRNLGTIDFIRQKQFEYAMDQKPFTTDNLLLEAEKAIHGTLKSDQSSAVSKSLLMAAESINAYRNHSVKFSEITQSVAEPSRVMASTGKAEA